jgi:hypothetical protein
MTNDCDYAVGYRKPPRETRFKKGQSGNPKGRPKKKSPKEQLRALLAQELNERVVITTKGGPRSITMFEAMLRQISGKAACGQAWAAKFLIEFIGQVDGDPDFSGVEVVLSQTDLKL